MGGLLYCFFVSPKGDHISLRREIWERVAKGLRPLAVPEKIIGLTQILDFFDRCDSFASLYPPLAALGSLPLWKPVERMLALARKGCAR